MAKDEFVTVRVRPEDMRRLDRVATGITIGSKHAVARACMLLGLAQVEADVTVLLRLAPTPKPAKAADEAA